MFRNMTFLLLVAAVAGYLCGSWFGDPAWVNAAETPAHYQLVVLVKGAFLDLLRMLIAPMILFSLIGGITGIGDVVRLRSLGGWTVLYYLATTGIAITIGLFVVVFVHPWEAWPAGTFAAQVADASAVRTIDASNASLVAILAQILDSAFVNPVKALVELNIIGIVANGIAIGIAMVLVLPPTSPLLVFVQHANLVIARVLGWIIRLLPVGLFAIMFDFSLRVGGNADLLTQLVSFALTVFGATMVHGVVVLPVLAWLFAGIPPHRLLRQVARPLLVAFSTSSSSATLPVSMQASETDMGVSKGVASFVLPLGATMNMDGTALFEAVAAVFLAWMFGVELSGYGVVMVFMMAMLSSIGAPGMPTASMAGMQVVLIAVGIPLEAIALLLIIERPLDTFRTAVNVQGDLVGAAIIDKRMRR